MSTTTPQRVTISSLAIVKVIGVILALIFLYLIRDIIFLILVSLVLAAAFDPWVDALQRKKIPRIFGILLIYTCFLSLISLLTILVVPLITQQFADLLRSIPQITQQLSEFSYLINPDQQEQAIKQAFDGFLGSFETGKTVSGLASALSSIAGGFIGLFAVLVMTFYMISKEDNIGRLVKVTTPEKYHDFFINLLEKISHKLGLWLRGQLIVALIVSTATYICLSLLGVKYALVFGVLYGVMQVVPFIGPWIAAVPGVIVAFLQSPILAAAAGGIFILINEIENNFLTPKIMSKAVGLSPILVIIALLIGAKLAGILGAILALPVAIVIAEGIKEFHSFPE